MSSERADATPRPSLLSQRFHDVRSLTDDLSGPLSAEDQTAQSMPDVSPTKWHRAHTTWFFETFVLEQYEDAFGPVDPSYRVLFNSYYDGVGEQYPRAARGVITRPGVAEIGDYRAEVDRRLVRLLADPGRPDDVDRLVELGLHHEQQHQELLLMDIKHVLAQHPCGPAYRAGLRSVSDRRSDEPTPGWTAVDGGLVEIGHDGDGFAFDNEAPRHRVHLESFDLANRLVTVGEWCAFVDDGGYERPELWLSDGWATVQRDGWSAPLYWRRAGDGRWTVDTLGGRREPDPAEPVCHVSHFEADAYARWAGARLPTEAEWEHAATSSAVAPGRQFDLDELHPRPATDARLGQLTGECWQWTASAYLPYPGFAPAAGAVGEYNGKFMSGQMVLRGSSALTPPGHVRPSYRNFFPPSARWPMTGVRLARDR